MKTQFTPGPWQKKPNSLRVETISEPHIAICYTDTFGTAGQAEGNAHLIAGAPEMYDELQWLVDCMEGVLTGDYKPDEETTAQARAVLAKAKGGVA